MEASSQAQDDRRWSRTPGWVDRVVGDNVCVKGRLGEDRTLGGIAAAVWIVLEEPGTRVEVTDRIRESWPGSPVEDDTVAEALTLLQAHGVVNHGVVRRDVGEPNPHPSPARR